MAAIATGCATPRFEPPRIVLRVGDRAVWIRPDEITGYRCEKGLLTCDDTGGRLSRRRCQCAE